jgi:hypothetical protein
MDYKSIYNRLCSKAKSENRIKGNGVYYENHHIIPACMGGSGDSGSSKPHPNLVLLTAREHYMAHKLLYFIHPNNQKIAHAFWCMMTIKRNGVKYNISSREYSELQEIASKSISGDNNPIHKMESNPFSNPEFIRRNSERNRNRIRTEEEKNKISESKKGSTASPETKLKMSKKRKGVKKTEDHIEKIKNSNTGKKRTSEQVKKMSEVRLGVPAPHTSETNKRMNSKMYLCPHCNREIGGRANFVRFHNDNCKLILNSKIKDNSLENV